MERTFPRHTRRRAHRALAVVSVLIGLLATTAAPTAQADELKQKHKAVKGHIRTVKADLDESSHALNWAMARLTRAEANLVSTRKAYAATIVRLHQAQALNRLMQARLVSAKADLVAAQAALAKGKLAVQNQRDDIGRLAAQNYEYGNPSLLGLLVMVNGQDPATMTTQLNTVDSLTARENNTLGALQVARDQLAGQVVTVMQVQQKVATQQQATAAAVTRKLALAVAAHQQKVQVQRLVAQREGMVRQARRIKQRDLRTLARLKAQENRILAMIRERAAHQKGGFTGATGGFLNRPVPGYVTSPYGWRIHPIYHYWGLHDGTDFHAPCGTPEVAAASGQVVSEYYSSVWGNRLFLDVGRVNGKNMTLIYNHISRYRVGPGTNVRRGETVAYAGTTGWSTGCHLHFTVMLDGNPVDPMQFIN